MQEKREEFREQFQMLGLRIDLYRKKAGLTQEQLRKKWVVVGALLAG